jgi:NAD(P)-dependent dehydrogenase (short-subunit alcohol dehydrogenase family)
MFMRVFVTGATGLIGSAVVAELIAHGHSVLGLARSDASAQALESAGAEPLHGALTDLDVLRAGARQADGVIHLAFEHGFTSAEGLMQSVAQESAAIATLGDALIGTDRPIVTASGTPQTAGRSSAESDPMTTEGPVGGRGRAVKGLLDLASRGVRSISRARAVSRAIRATARSVGRRSMRSMLRRCSGLRLSAPRLVPAGTRSPTRGMRYAKSRRS